MLQVTETDQEADALVHNVAHVCVPAQMAVENHSQVFDSPALLNGLRTDPYADRWEVTGVLTGAEEKDFCFGCV